MALGYTQLCQESPDIGVVAGLPQLVNPAGTNAKLLCHQEHILHCTGTVCKSVCIVFFIGCQNNDIRVVKIVTFRAV